MTVETPCGANDAKGHSTSVNGFLQNNLISTVRRLEDLESGLSSPSSRKFTVYLNGVSGIGQEVTVEFDQLSDWNDFLLELDSGVTFSAPTNEVFSLTGEQLGTIEDVMSHDSVVVSSGQPFIPLQYKSLSTIHQSDLDSGLLLPKNVQLRKSPVGSARKFMRSGLAKSVFAIDGSFQGSSSSTNELNSLLKTMSEEQMCFRENQTRVHSQLPNSVARQSFHAKPRPVSCYGAPHSMYSSEVSSVVKKSPSSRIPKRIPVTHSQEASFLSASMTTVPQAPSVPLKIPITNCKSAIPTSPQPKTEKIINSRTAIPKEKLSRQELQSKRDFICPRIVCIIRTGTKPRKIIRYLLNQKSARSFEQVLSDMTERLQASWGAIRKVFTLSGLPVETLEEFFKVDRVFLACPSDRHVQEDFVLDTEEIKSIPNYVKLFPGAAKGKSSDVLQRTPQKRGKSPQANERTLPSTYPTHPKYLAVSQLPNFILDKYFVGDIIGDGNFAVVRDCIHRTSGARYALKVIDKTKSGLDAPAEHEVRILKSLNHPSIVHLFEDYEFEDELFVVMEHVSGGDLFDTIAQCIKFTEEDSASFTKDIASAISFLHARGIVHRDIKPENLLVYHDKDNKRRIKVGDFGLAHYIQDDCLLYTVCGTPTYVAPEILAETGYSYRVDVWALGIILYILLCGYPPFASTTGEQADLFDLILVGDYEFPPEQWDGISEDAKDLIMKMIESDVDIRLSADDVLDHPWLCTNVEEAEAKRSNFFKNDFRFNVFEQMGLSKLGS